MHCVVLGVKRNGTRVHANVFVREICVNMYVHGTLLCPCLRAKYVGNFAELFSDRRPFCAVCRLSPRCNHLLLRGNHLQHCELHRHDTLAILHVALDVHLDHAQHNLAGNLCHSSVCHLQTG